jgi:hypothetical protein
MHTFGVVLMLLLENMHFFHMHQSSHSSYRDRTQFSWAGTSLLASHAMMG